MTIAKVQSAQNHFDDALSLLKELESHNQGDGRTGRLIQNLILQAVTLHNKGVHSKAYPILEKALELAETEKYARSFIDEGHPMLDLLKRWLAHSSANPLKEYVQHLIVEFPESISLEADRKDEPGYHEKLIEQLTQRETEVLTLIAEGKTNKEISLVLVVSPGTVKAHTSNIYRKLDVSNRTEAVSRARELGILP
jgi:LuxR family maltose regulon positive regulatory protein